MASLPPLVAADGAPVPVDAGVRAATGQTIGYTLASTASARPFVASIGVETGEPLAANSADGVAAIPLPPSAYPGMVGLATAALSVWRYRRRRR